MGKLKDTKVKIHIDTSIKPVARRGIGTPFHLCDKAGKEIETSFKEDIKEKVESEPTPWISPIDSVPKKKQNEIRVCVDMCEHSKSKKGGKAILRETFDANGRGTNT